MDDGFRMTSGSTPGLESSGFEPRRQPIEQNFRQGSGHHEAVDFAYHRAAGLENALEDTWGWRRRHGEPELRLRPRAGSERGKLASIVNHLGEWQMELDSSRHWVEHEATAVKPVDFSYHRATSLDDALERLATGGDGAKLIGGGQSLGPMLNLRLSRPRELIDISSVEALRRIESTQESVITGAAVTHAEIEDRPASDPIEHAMREVAAGIAYRAVRNRGTLGGSIVHADPAADWSSFLLCVSAQVRIRGIAGERDVPMQDFTRTAYTTALAPDEIVTRIEIPRTTGRARFGFYKLCRKTGELAEAMGAVLIDPGRRYCRVVAGAVGPKPVVLAGAARSLAASAAPSGLEKLRTEIAAGTHERDPVRLHMAAVAVRRAIDRALAAR